MNDFAWNDERDDLMIKFTEQGFSASTTAQKLGNGATRCAVIGRIYRLRAAGREIVKGPKNQSLIPLDTRKEILSLADSTKTNDEIARISGLTYEQVTRIYQEAGIKRKSTVGHKLAHLPQTVKRNAEVANAGPQNISEAWFSTLDRFKEGFRGQTGRLAFIELRTGLCHYPIDQPEGPVRYCGLDADGRYCPEHARRCGDGYEPNGMRRLKVRGRNSLPPLLRPEA